MPQFKPFDALTKGDIGVTLPAGTEIFNPDVSTTAPVDGDSLTYVAATDNWVPSSGGGGGGGSLQVREQAHDTGHSTGAYQWICPDGVTDIRLSMAGCGGAGGNGNGTLASGGGGGAGGYIINESIVGLMAGETYTISIPAGGTGAGLNATFNGTFYGIASHEIACLGGSVGGNGQDFFGNFAGGAAGPGGAAGGVRVNGAFNNITTGGAGGVGGGNGSPGANGNIVHKRSLANTQVGTAAGSDGGGGGGSSRSSGGNGATGFAGGGGGGGGWLSGATSTSITGNTGGSAGIRIEFIGASTDGLITEV